MRRARPLLALLLLLPVLALANPAAPFLWQVDGPHTRHYLLGSIHLLPESARKLPPALETAYELSEELVFESDLASLASPELQRQLLVAAKSAQPLKATLPAPLHERLRRRAEAVGLPLQLCEGFKPWFCALSLELFNLQSQGFRPELGLDQRYYQRALTDNRPVHSLEAPAEHLALFTQMPEAEGQEFLASMLVQMETREGTPAELLELWRSGDGSRLEALVVEWKQKSPAVYERLLARRNRQWQQRLQPLLQGERPLLVIVGAAHLYGPDGLVTLLQQKGYRPRPMAIALPAAAPAR